MTQVIEHSALTPDYSPAAELLPSVVKEPPPLRRSARVRFHDLAIRLDERSRLGRELHDSTAQHLVSLQLRMGQLRQALKGSAPTELFADLDATIQTLHREIRLLALGSAMPIVQRGQFVHELQAMAEQFGRVAGLAIVIDAHEFRQEPAILVQVALYRVAQEALANASRHGHARSIRIILRSTLQSAELVVEDDGVGLGGDHRPGCGLRNMRDRLRGVGGALTLGNMVAGGTRLVAAVPIKN